MAEEHVLSWWERLEESACQQLRDELGADRSGGIARAVFAARGEGRIAALVRVRPMPHPQMDGAQRHAFAGLGQQAFRRGEVAFLLVAGGQGAGSASMIPRACFPIGPVSNKILFQIHAEKMLALRRRHGAAIPFLVMTSPATHARNASSSFEQHQFFGLAGGRACGFFARERCPPSIWRPAAVLESRAKLCLSPNGHGGTLTGLVEQRLLSRLEQRHYVRSTIFRSITR